LGFCAIKVSAAATALKGRLLWMLQLLCGKCLHLEGCAAGVVTKHCCEEDQQGCARQLIELATAMTSKPTYKIARNY
jgi:hypothetical protein